MTPRVYVLTIIIVQYENSGGIRVCDGSRTNRRANDIEIKTKVLCRLIGSIIYDVPTEACSVTGGV